MIVKDYYKIMDVKPSASEGEIKRSYRRLAMKYHPDKNPGDAIAEATFAAIAEAYEILSNPTKRRDYDYKNVNAYKYETKEKAPVTKDSIMKNISKLRQTVISSDPYRINRDALYFQLAQMLTIANIEILQKENDTEANRYVIDQLIQSSKPLHFNAAKKISELFYAIALNDGTARNMIDEFLQDTLRTSLWNRYKPLIAIIAAIILCLFIFLLSK